MPVRSSAIAVSLTTAVSLCAVLAAQPRISNGRLSTQTAGSPFAQSFRALISSQTEVTWIGYVVPVVNAERMMCCFDSSHASVSSSVTNTAGQPCCGACRLEPAASGTSMWNRAQRTGEPIRLEASDRMVVLFRVEERTVDRVRVFSEDCELDAGGRPVVWLQNVRPGDSIGFLESLVAPSTGRRDRVADGAVTAIALHADSSADTVLERLVGTSQPEAIRKKVTFWLGNARGKRGLDLLRRVLREDPSMEVRKSAVFGVSQSHEPDAFDALATIARTGEHPRIRGEALFWLGQQSDARAPKVILEALDKDPASEVRKKAVFALSQLKEDTGVDALIRVARTHSDASTRGEAIFWLGQTAGAKASAAIRETIDQDPETAVKEKAVFALSQLPKNEGVPLLISVARTHDNPAVRKRAMFWLGQSRDPRAIEFFAEVLGRK
jgi:hypothetical protein